MISTRSIFERMEGQSLTNLDLRRQLDDVVAQNLGQIPPEVRTRELLQVAGQNKWIVQDSDGKLVIKVRRHRRSHR
jgi:hypothetical protein